MRSFLVRKINNFTKTLSLRAKVPNTFGARLYILIYSLNQVLKLLFSCNNDNDTGDPNLFPLSDAPNTDVSCSMCAGYIFWQLFLRQL